MTQFNYKFQLPGINHLKEVTNYKDSFCNRRFFTDFRNLYLSFLLKFYLFFTRKKII